MNARRLIDSLVEGRDDIGTLNIPASGKRNARMSGAFGTSPGKFKLWTKMISDLVNGGKVTGFKNKDAAGPVSMSHPPA